MKNLIKIAITLTAIGVAVKVADMNKKDTSKIFVGYKNPNNASIGDLWFKP